MKDYYKTLGISPKADQAEIKRAFKTLAKKYHPDMNKGNSEAESRFKELSEAYDVLGNPASRQEYDLQRESPGLGHPGKRWASQGPGSEFFSENLEDLLRQFGGGAGRDWKRFGRSTGSKMGGFDQFFSESPEPEAAQLKVPLKVACTGGQIRVSGLPGGPQTIKIPPHSRTGSIVSVSTSEGRCDLELSIEDDPPFFVQGDNIETTLTINVAQAILGSKIKFRDPHGDEFIITIPPGSQPGDRLRLKGLGLGDGDMFITLNIEIPKKLSEKDQELFISFAKAHKLKF